MTSVDGQGSSGKVNLIFMVIKRCQLGRVTELIGNTTRKRFIRWRTSGR